MEVEIECEECDYSEENVETGEIGPTVDMFGFKWTCPECGHDNMWFPNEES